MAMAEYGVEPVQFIHPIPINGRRESYRQYLGVSLGNKAQALVKRTFWIPKDIAVAADQMAASEYTDYTCSEDVFRHAVFALIEALVQAGFPSDEIPESLRTEQTMQQAAFDAERIERASQNYSVLVRQVDLARQAGNWEDIVAHFNTLEGWLAKITTKTEYQVLLHAVSRHPQVAWALQYLLGCDKASKEARELAKVWRARLDDWSEA